MSSCCSSFWAASQWQFSDAVARRDLKRYRQHGPDATTRLLRDAILRAGNRTTVLDVGAGIGALGFELLAAGAERVTAVEAAPAYLAAAREEAGRRSVAHRLELVQGDFLLTRLRVISATVAFSMLVDPKHGEVAARAPAPPGRCPVREAWSQTLGIIAQPTPEPLPATQRRPGAAR